MNPWVSSVLFSPVVALVLLGVVVLFSIGLKAVGNVAFRRAGGHSFVVGYLLVAIVVLPFALFLGDFSWEGVLEAWVGLVFVAWLTLAVVLIPLMFVLVLLDHVSIFFMSIVGVVGAIAVQTVLYLMSGSVAREAFTGLRLIDDFVRLAVFFSVIVVAFSVGSRLLRKKSG